MFVVSKDQNSAALLTAGRPPRYFVAEAAYQYCNGCSLFSPDRCERSETGIHCDVVLNAPAQIPYCGRPVRADGAEIIWKEVTQ